MVGRHRRGQQGLLSREERAEGAPTARTAASTDAAEATRDHDHHDVGARRQRQGAEGTQEPHGDQHRTAPDPVAHDTHGRHQHRAHQASDGQDGAHLRRRVVLLGQVQGEDDGQERRREAPHGPPGVEPREVGRDVLRIGGGDVDGGDDAVV